MPTFLVIGAMRCGTSSLFAHLRQHPDVSASLRKEIEYFSLGYERGPAWYAAHFPLEWQRLLNPRLQTFEASHYYLFHPQAPIRAAAKLPSAKIVAVLRDPVARAFSHWRHMVRVGVESLGFVEALEREEERIGEDSLRLRTDPYYVSHAHYSFSYVARSLYRDQLRAWAAPYPRTSILIVPSSGLNADCTHAWHHLLDFLSLAEWIPTDFKNYSYSRAPATRAAGDMPLRARGILTQRLQDEADFVRSLGTEGSLWADLEVGA